MFTVTDVRNPFLFWVSVELTAEEDMSLSGQRLRMGRWHFGTIRPPVVETRIIRVKAGERFTIEARKRDGFRGGERVPLERVSEKRAFNQRWQILTTF